MRIAIGALVSANEPLYRIAHNNEIELEAHVPEAELAALKIGQKVVFTVTGRADEMEGKVRLITPRIDPANRTAMIRVALAANTSLPVGLFADATIIAGEVSGMVIPATALQQDTIGSFVWHVTAENKAARLPVRVIFRSNEDIVVNDIPNDARIVARAGAFVKEGDSLNVTGGNE